MKKQLSCQGHNQVFDGNALRASAAEFAYRYRLPAVNAAATPGFSRLGSTRDGSNTNARTCRRFNLLFSNQIRYHAGVPIKRESDLR